MSAAFSRSIRSLETDGFRTSMVGLAILAALFGLWLAWFFLARVALYEVSASAQMVAADRVEASFPLTALGHLRPGQAARMRLDGFPWTQYGTLSATVGKVEGQPRNGRVQVLLKVAPHTTSPIPLQAGLTGVVEVAVDQVSPATLTLRAAGQLVTPAQPAVSSPGGQP